MNRELILKIPLSLFILKLTLCSILRLTPSFYLCISDNPTHTQELAPNVFLSSPHPWVFPCNFFEEKIKGEENMGLEKDIN